MLGWQIFVHSVRMVFRNWRQAIRIGLIPSTVVAIATFLFFESRGTQVENQSWVDWIAAMSVVSQIGFLLIVVANLFVIIWIFVAWHRFVLLEEYPRGWIPPLKTNYILQYFTQGMKVIAIAFLVSFSVSLALLVVLVFLTNASLAPRAVLNLPPLVSAFISFFVVFRLGLAFPATAIGQVLKIKDVIKLTSGKIGTLLFLAIIQIFGMLLTSAVIGGVAITLPAFSIATEVLVQLFFSLIYVSIWTTMYGVFIEKRELA